MKSLKIVFIFMLSLTMLISAVSCTSGKDKLTGALSDIMASVLEGVDELPAVGDIEIDDTNFEAFLFIKPIEGAEALASEGLINAIAHSVVLLRVPDGTDAEKTAEEIRKNVNPRKWICTEAEKVMVEVRGDVIILIMSFENVAQSISDNFMALQKS